MGFQRDILDHGYLKVIETWGSDQRIIEAARMSVQGGFKGWGTPEAPGDEKLLAFLYRNNHSTPFEMAGAIIEAQAPIVVFREWHRHRTQAFSEASARYSPLPDTNYIPTLARTLQTQAGNKQAQGTGAVLTDKAAIEWLSHLDEAYRFAEEVYQEGLSLGVPKELARLCVPVGRYSKMRASANLRNWLGFLTLREAPNAQEEIRLYANAMHDALTETFPRTMALFSERAS